jgi:hypothetical protein
VVPGSNPAALTVSCTGPRNYDCVSKTSLRVRRRPCLSKKKIKFASGLNKTCFYNMLISDIM